MTEHLAPRKYSELPLVYACSGCSSAAQLANSLALKLDHEALAEMSCIAGLGGDVLSLVRVAQSGRPIIALDGCPLHCARHCLARHGIEPEIHLDLSRLGIKKRKHQLASLDEEQRVWQNHLLPVLRSYHGENRVFQSDENPPEWHTEQGSQIGPAASKPSDQSRY